MLLAHLCVALVLTIVGAGVGEENSATHGGYKLTQKKIISTNIQE